MTTRNIFRLFALAGLLGHASSFYLPMTRINTTPRRLTTGRRNGSIFLRKFNKLWSIKKYTKSSPLDCKRFSLLTISEKFHDYVSVLRPVTIFQAVGALLVGYLAISSGQIEHRIMQLSKIFSASLSVYLSYGCGMLMNDLVDADDDNLHNDKQNRAIASGRISIKSGWTYCASLVAVSLALGKVVDSFYATWVGSNLCIMLFYALGLQKIFLLKNILCGWLAISPLIGASLLTRSIAGTEIIAARQHHKLLSLAAVGFPMQVSREILKDIEDVDIDKGKKNTLPLVIGEKASHFIAYGIITMNICVMVFTRYYWELFSCKIPLYPIGVIAGTLMSIKASILSLKDGQKLVKKSIYVLLAAMIMSLSLQ